MSSEYWEKRQREWIEKQAKNDADFKKKISKYYDDATLKAQQDINDFYMRFAKKENITMAEARKRVKEFDVKGFEKRAKEMVKNQDFSDEANERLRIYNATMRINRLEMLKSKLAMDYLEANNKLDNEMKKQFTDYLTGEAKHQAGILGKTIPDDLTKRIEQLVNASYKGATFSERLWASQDQLKGELDNILTRGLIMGQNPRQLASRLKPLINDAVNNKKYVTEKIAVTESARMAHEYRTKLYKENDVKEVKWIAETTACKICLPRDNKVYKLGEEPDIPAHPYCRCNVIPNYEEVE